MKNEELTEMERNDLEFQFPNIKNYKLIHKDCSMVFSNGQEPYKFCSDDLGKALKWAKETNVPVQAIVTPWFVLSPLDEDTYKQIVDIFND